MNLFWSLYALFTAHWCLDKVSGSPDLDLCNSTGELPAPELFLDAGSGHMGNSIVLLCMHPSEGTVTRFFFCKDKTLLSVRKAISHLGIYKLSITQDFTGQYSCGYQHRNEMNQETSALSSVRNLMVLSDKKWAIISGVLGFVILILAALIYLLVKKAMSLTSGTIANNLSEEVQCTTLP
ncbi:uncharacterized protein PHA67_018529 isoform 1-T1 [Liasis olivaceus]